MIADAIAALHDARLLSSVRGTSLPTALDAVDAARRLEDAAEQLRAIAAGLRAEYELLAIDHLEDGGERSASTSTHRYHVEERIHWRILDSYIFAQWCKRHRIPAREILEAVRTERGLRQLCDDIVRADNLIPAGVGRFAEARVVRRKRK